MKQGEFVATPCTKDVVVTFSRNKNFAERDNALRAEEKWNYKYNLAGALQKNMKGAVTA